MRQKMIFQELIIRLKSDPRLEKGAVGIFCFVFLHDFFESIPIESRISSIGGCYHFATITAKTTGKYRAITEIMASPNMLKLRNKMQYYIPTNTMI